MGGFRLGRMFGVEIRIDYSWFIILFLVVWTFSQVVFPAQFPALSAGVHLAMGLSAALFFFASLLAHELSHAFVAQAKGIAVEGITLFIFGGVARTRAEAATPGDEFAIAAIGPVTSIALSLLLGGAALVGARYGVHPAVTGVASYLAILNLVLAIFNLLPGFPLDGGRIFRSIVWKLSGSLHRATRWATVAGQVVGYLIMGLGVLQAVTGGIINGLWLVFIGWFIRMTATHSWRQHVLHSILKRLAAGDAMTRHPETVPAELNLDRVVGDYFMRRRYHAFPVERDGRLEGLLTLAQVRAVPRAAWPDQRAADVMTPVSAVVRVTPHEPMDEVVREMERARTRYVLVLDDGRLVGIITTTDVLGWADRAREMMG
jgi:Zn-dependent protease/predicted transcriptional regulator